MTRAAFDAKVVRLITRLNIGGPAQHVILLTAHLPARGFPSMLVAGQVDQNEGDMSDLALRHQLAVRWIPFLRNGAPIVSDVRAFLALYRLFRREQPSIVHLHLLKARVLGGLAARLARVPIVVETFHGTLFSGYYARIGTRMIVWIERGLARLMDGVIAVSQEVAAELVRLKIAPAGKISVILLGLDLDRFIRDQAPRGAFRRELGVSDDAPLVGAIGRLVGIKRVPDLLQAMVHVVRVHPESVLVLVGDGPERSTLERLARRLGLTREVRFAGWRKDLERVYPDLDVVVLSSLHEGTPVSVIEAMTAGRSVVATRVGGVPDLIVDGVTGLLVPPKDPGALAEAVLRLLGDADLRRRMGTAARAAAYPRFSAERLMSDVAAYYEGLLRSRGLPAERGT